MDTHRLRLLVELHHRGTMRAVAQATGYGTSTISAHLGTLEREVGTQLLEHAGRTVRFTPAGHLLVEHAERILAAVEAARAAIGPGAAPCGRLRVASYRSALSADLLPITRQLATSHPDLRLELQEREPPEVAALLDDDEIDLGFVYDYNLVRKLRDDGATVREICSTPVLLAVPEGADPAQLPWVVNSRGTDDFELALRFCVLAGFEPQIAHRADSLDLVLEIVAARLGIALLPAFAGARPGVNLIPPQGLDIRRRMFAVTRPGRHLWPGVALVTDLVSARARSAAKEAGGSVPDG